MDAAAPVAQAPGGLHARRRLRLRIARAPFRRRRQITSVNSRDQLADLLARHGRIEELRAYAVLDGHEEAVQRLAELLEEDGDVEGAIAVYGQADGPAARDANSAYELAQLLARHGRGGEAIAVMRAQADAHHSEDWILHALSELCLDQGRPADGLAHLDAVDAQRRGGDGGSCSGCGCR
ncbi:tetratricopeptide repeat protein [Streptomyces sp. CO7]